MGIGQYKENFDKDCQHDWKLHMDADSHDRKSNSIFLCSKCGTLITMLERNSLDSLRLKEKSIKDSLVSQKESQKIQERTMKMSMWANVVATVTVIIASLVFLFGEGLFK
jgi:hypothetical protein